MVKRASSQWQCHRSLGNQDRRSVVKERAVSYNALDHLAIGAGPQYGVHRLSDVRCTMNRGVQLDRFHCIRKQLMVNSIFFSSLCE